MARQIDYGLARRAMLRDVRAGRVARTDVCDAHPELLRAARHLGRPAGEGCPLCEAPLRLVSYVYGDQLKSANGRCLTGTEELDRLAAQHDELAHYEVEACLDCGWNYLRRQTVLGRRVDAPAARRSRA